MIKLWLDDFRLPPDDSWTHAYTAKEAIAILDSADVDVVSLDFDLGEEERCGSGLDVARHLVALTKRGRPMPRVVMLHGISKNFTGTIYQVETTKTIQYWVQCGKCQKQIAGQIRWGSDPDGVAFMQMLDRHHDGCSRLPVMFRRRTEPQP